MKKILIGLITICLLMGQAKAQTQVKNTTNFDDGWRFHLGSMLGAEQIEADDSRWLQIDLPHDWSIEDKPGTKSPFDRDAISQVNGGFTAQGTGWYRKTFVVSATDKGQQIIIQFDGVYMNSDVYINGHHVGNHPYGYTSFYYDITSEIKFGGKNIIAVEVKNEGQNSRWYSGSGIYRHVWLKTVNPVHIAEWGTYITTPKVNASFAEVNVKTQLLNQAKTDEDIQVITRLIAPGGAEAGKLSAPINLTAGTQRELNDSIKIDNPELWSCESPVLYKAITEIYRDGKLINSETNTFGIRQISFEALNGFQLNGKTVKLKGGCFHNDNGPLGAKAYDRAEERKVDLLKASGFNAIRCSHNPPSPAFLDACDREGILVIDEAYDMWNYGKNPYDYHLYFKDWWQRDMNNMLIRDRNHPSVIMWSIGNEIPEKATPEGVETAKMLAGYVRNTDPTRPVTSAVNDLNLGKDPYFAALDVCGYNYAINKGNVYIDDHKRMPGRIMFGTESYPMEAFGSWMAVEDNPYIIGDFVWTAWDYIGEASIGWLGYPQNNNFYPWNLAFCGDIDICGWKRPQSYYRDALWKKNQVSVFVKQPVESFPSNPAKAEWSKWNWYDVVPEWGFEGYENKPLEVTVYSSCSKAELFLNGKSLGIKTTNRDTKFIATWMVPYKAGVLKVVGYDGNEKVASAELKTATVTTQIKLNADRIRIKADNQDLSYVTVELADAQGNINPRAVNLIKFQLIGDAKIVGVGNANPISLESCQLPERKAWKGKCLVIIKAGCKPGTITLKAISSGLSSASIKLSTEACDN